MSPRVSVLIPSYNHADYLPACLSSLQAQSLEDWEVIIVDDQSQDGSRDLLGGITDERIRVLLNETNLGTYGSLARALEAASGEFVAVLNSDDLWEPAKLDLQVKALTLHPSSRACFTLGTLVDSEGAPLPTNQHAGWPCEEVCEVLPYLLSENRILASSVMFRRAGARFDPRLRYSGDWVALLGASSGSALTCIADPLTKWRQHSFNTYRASAAQMREELGVRQAILDRGSRWLRAGLDVRLVRQKLGECAMHASVLRVRLGDVQGARSFSKTILSAGLGASGLRRVLALWMPRSSVIRRFGPVVESGPGTIPSVELHI